MTVHTVKKPHVLNEQERGVFDILTRSIEHSMYILPRIHVEDLFELTEHHGDKEFWAKFERISHQYLDFLVCDRKTFTPLLVMIIRGESHHERLDKTDEEFLKSILSHSDIPLLDISLAEIREYRSAFVEESIRVRIRSALGLE